MIVIIVSLRLKEFRKFATSTEITIIDYILENKGEVTGLSVHDLAKKTYTSSSSIVRLCKKIGLTGYKDFLRRLIIEETERKNNYSVALPNIDRDDDLDNIISKITHTNIISLQKSEQLIDSIMLKTCIDLIMNSEKLVFFWDGSILLGG